MKYSIMRNFQTTVVLALLVAWGQAAGQATVAVSIAEKQPYGAYLVDMAGMSLYLFKADMQGKKSTCYGDCAEVWLPLLTWGKPQVSEKADKALLGTIKRTNGSMEVIYDAHQASESSEKVDKALLGIIERKNGSMQVTYDGWPLYYFLKDSGPGDTKGQGVEGFGAEWYLVTPQGKPVHAKGHEQEK
jgi:predicted lipoprotein with Yx(FWY)xxD motif